MKLHEFITILGIVHFILENVVTAKTIQESRIERLSNILHAKMVEKHHYQALEQTNNTFVEVDVSQLPSTTGFSTMQQIIKFKDPPLESNMENVHPSGIINNPKTTSNNSNVDTRKRNDPLVSNGKLGQLLTRNASNTLKSQNLPDNNASRKKYCSEFDNNYRYYCLSTPSGTSEREQMIDFCTAYEENCLQSLSTQPQTYNKKNLEEQKLNAKSEWFGSFNSEIETDNDHRSRHDDSEGDLDVDLKIPDVNHLPSKVEISIYCDDYSKNYLYFCLLPLKKSSVLRARLLIFCPAYEKICNNRSRETGAPTDPRSKPNDPFVVFQELKDPKKAAEKLQQNKNPVPCTPDCDQRRWPHCTPECKCDYMYPYVQTFCNPPPMTLFLQTCRLWYRGCPKYEQFHYASQFIHSKANKGKVLPGIADNRPHTDPNIATMPIQRESPLSTNEGEYVNWDAEDLHKKEAYEHYNRITNSSWYDIALDSLSTKNRPIKMEDNAKRERSKHSDTSRSLWTQFKIDSEQTDASKPGTRAIWDRIAERASDLPTDVRTKYAKLLRSDAFPFDSASDSTVHRFDQFSDSRGLVHQARTKSPFTKPGLWEPNPDNPHNRDHANKFYYAPVSVSADWLSGQLAWGGHWAVPAASVGGTNGYSTVHFPSVGSFLGIDDDYD